MKLYYTPGACSLSPHIILNELAIVHETEAVDIPTHTTESGRNFFEINDKGYVPALLLDSGDILTEGTAIIQYLADLKPEKELIPKPGTLSRARVQEWIGFISTEIHKPLGSLLYPSTDLTSRNNTYEKIDKRLLLTERKVSGSYITGEAFCVADAYLFAVLNWTKLPFFDTGIKLENYPKLNSLYQRIRSRPAVSYTVNKEGLTV
ncbi:glutathione S-transferase family protein [Pseudomonas aeruginosa]